MGREHCQYCAYYVSKRTFSSGILFGSSVRAEDNRAVCSKENKEVWGSGWCRHFTPCAEFQKLLNEEENKRIEKENEAIAKKVAEENEKARREQDRMYHEQERELRREREALRKEREEFEYRQWYAGLSKKQKIAEDIRLKKKEEEEQERIYQEEMERARIKREEERKREIIRIQEEAKKKKCIKGFIIFNIGFIITMIGVLGIGMKNSILAIILGVIGNIIATIGIIVVLIGFFKKTK